MNSYRPNIPADRSDISRFEECWYSNIADTPVKYHKSSNLRDNSDTVLMYSIAHKLSRGTSTDVAGMAEVLVAASETTCGADQADVELGVEVLAREAGELGVD